MCFNVISHTRSFNSAVCVWGWCQGQIPSGQLWPWEDCPELETISRSVFPRSTPSWWAEAIFEVDRWSVCSREYVSLWLTERVLGIRGQVAGECWRESAQCKGSSTEPCVQGSEAGEDWKNLTVWVLVLAVMWAFPRLLVDLTAGNLHGHKSHQFE